LDYQAALSRLLSLSDFERRADQTIVPKMDLGRIAALLARLGSPHLSAPAVHVTGTKGKGSTSAMVASVLRAQGYRTGLFTSPHLHTFCERIRLDGQMVPQQRFAELLNEAWPHLEAVGADPALGQVTTFELLTAMAFLYFAQERVDLQVLEVGMGGRLDSTNVCKPAVCVITSISLDHMEVLGDTVALIAGEKAGIIKEGVPVVTSPQTEEALAVIRRAAHQRHAPLVEVGKSYQWSLQENSLEGQAFGVSSPRGERLLAMPLLGAHQLENAATALAALDVLQTVGYPVTAEAMVEGFRGVDWPGRLEVLRQRPLVVADGAHNPYSLRRVLETLPQYFAYRNLVVVLGCGRGHDLEGMMAELVPFSLRIVVTRSRHPAAMPTWALREAVARHGIAVQEVEGVDRAVDETVQQAGEDDLVLATGSLFVVAEAIEAVKRVPAELYPSLPRSRRLPQQV